MADVRNGCNPGNADFKEAVCVDVSRVYDSCCDRDCLEDLRCYFTAECQEVINNAINVKLNNAEILKVYIDVEPVNFNKGYYSCDLTFFFLLDFEVFTAPLTAPEKVRGVAVFNKKVILYGSDGNVKIFSSTMQEDDDPHQEKSYVRRTSNMPKCVVQAVDPVALSARMGEVRDCYEHVGFMPRSVAECVGGDLVTDLRDGDPAVYVTLGLFSIIQLVRNVQMLVPVYDFCIPEKQCNDVADQPCETFRKIKFPTSDFFPPRASDLSSNSSCGCGR